MSGINVLQGFLGFLAVYAFGWFAGRGSERRANILRWSEADLALQAYAQEWSEREPSHEEAQRVLRWVAATALVTLKR